LDRWWKFRNCKIPAGAGTQTAGLGFGGSGPTGATEEYDGTSWTTSPGSLAASKEI
jgi:hypothetical protein